ncbi:hypothetical protein EG878_14735 [Enterococcus faecalis]|nr:hypothetical protein EG878_14735 [Enterococcus faecalis]
MRTLKDSQAITWTRILLIIVCSLMALILYLIYDSAAILARHKRLEKQLLSGKLAYADFEVYLTPKAASIELARMNLKGEEPIE